MAKVKCSDFAQAINDLAMVIGSQDGIETLDDVVAEIQKTFPVMPREEIVNAIVDANSYESKKNDELKTRLAEIKRNAKMEKETARKIAQVEEYLNTGKLPPVPKPRKAASETLRQARNTLSTLRKWLKTADPAMQKAMQEKLDALNKRIESGDVVMDEKREGELHDTLKALQSQIEAARRQIADEKTIRDLEARIETLRGHLDAGTLPEAKAKAQRGSSPADLLRDIRDDLQRQLAKSEPAQKARIEKQIAALEERIAAGDLHPAVKPPELVKSKELERLIYQRDRLRHSIRLAVESMKPRSIWSHIADPFNAIRAIKTSFDFSAVFRQGGVIALAHPIRAARALPGMFKAFASPRLSAKINSDIHERPNAPLYARAGLYLAPTDGTEGLAAREEAFMSRLVEKIPGVAASQRAYVTFLNVLRADSFDTMAATLSATGEPTLKEAQAIATFINEATGRGSLGIEKGSVALNTVFFAPKYTASRFQLLFGHPLWGGTISTRKMIAKEYARYLVGLAAVYVLGWLAGGDPEDDPRSSDFGKLRFGDTRIDPLSGISQTAVLVGRLTTGETKSATTGKVSPIRGADVPYGGVTVPDVVARFLRSKLSPTLGIPLDMVSGENVVGEEVNLASMPLRTVAQVLMPLQFQDIYDAAKEQGLPPATAMSVLSIFGMGLQTYSPFSKMDDGEVLDAIAKNTYRYKSRDHNAGDPHKDSEDRVNALKQEYQKRTGRGVTPRDIQEAQNRLRMAELEKRTRK